MALSFNNSSLSLDLIKEIDNRFGLDVDVGPVVAGGAARRALLAQPYKGHDFDVYFKNSDQLQHFKDKLLIYDFEEEFTTHNASTYIGLINNIRVTIQTIHRKFFNKSIVEILRDFDFTICCLATDGYNLIDQSSAIHHNKMRSLVAQNINGGKLIAIHRLIKFLNEGYHISDIQFNNFLNQLNTLPDLIDEQDNPSNRHSVEQLARSLNVFRGIIMSMPERAISKKLKLYDVCLKEELKSDEVPF